MALYFLLGLDYQYHLMHLVNQLDQNLQNLLYYLVNLLNRWRLVYQYYL
tara:strand:+ start:320 stop:466 length:147 start_codon:yes stop_codon:yes gene_type:complete